MRTTMLVLALLAAGCGGETSAQDLPPDGTLRTWHDEGGYLYSTPVPGGRIYRYASSQGPITFVPDPPSVPK